MRGQGIDVLNEPLMVMLRTSGMMGNASQMALCIVKAPGHALYMLCELRL